MIKDNLYKDWLKKNGEKLKIAYSYAVVNKLDITSKDDILKILKVTDPENANEEQVRIYSKMLQLFRIQFREVAKKSLSD